MAEADYMGRRRPMQLIREGAAKYPTYQQTQYGTHQSDTSLDKATALSWLHNTLAGLGMTPVGAPFDLIDAGVYGVEALAAKTDEDRSTAMKNMGWSAAALLPFGIFARTAQNSKKFTEAADEGRKLAQEVNDLSRKAHQAERAGNLGKAEKLAQEAKDKLAKKPGIDKKYSDAGTALEKDLNLPGPARPPSSAKPADVGPTKRNIAREQEFKQRKNVQDLNKKRLTPEEQKIWDKTVEKPKSKKIRQESGEAIDDIESQRGRAVLTKRTADSDIAHAQRQLGQTAEATQGRARVDFGRSFDDGNLTGFRAGQQQGKLLQGAGRTPIYSPGGSLPGAPGGQRIIGKIQDSLGITDASLRRRLGVGAAATGATVGVPLAQKEREASQTGTENVWQMGNIPTPKADNTLRFERGKGGIKPPPLKITTQPAGQTRMMDYQNQNQKTPPVAKVNDGDVTRLEQEMGRDKLNERETVPEYAQTLYGITEEGSKDQRGSFRGEEGEMVTDLGRREAARRRQELALAARRAKGTGKPRGTGLGYLRTPDEVLNRIEEGQKSIQDSIVPRGEALRRARERMEMARAAQRGREQFYRDISEGPSDRSVPGRRPNPYMVKPPPDMGREVQEAFEDTPENRELIKNLGFGSVLEDKDKERRRRSNLLRRR